MQQTEAEATGDTATGAATAADDDGGAGLLSQVDGHNTGWTVLVTTATLVIQTLGGTLEFALIRQLAYN